MERNPLSSTDEEEQQQEEEDHQTLIPRNNTFHMEPHNSSSRHLINKINKKCCLISTMFIFLIILISVDIITKLPSSALTGQMRESELKALLLLKQQQRALSSFLDKNRNLGNLTNTHLSSELLKQISLSREIEDVLFRPSGGGNFSGEGYGIGGCGKVDRSGLKRRTIEWKPRPDKFLLAVCVSGQMSNHLICLEKHMFFAALLNRVLVVPSSKVDYEYSRVVDVEHINKCVGRNVVVGFDEFVEMKNKGKGSVSIDRFVCYFSKPELCFMDAERVKKLKDLGISIGMLESPWEEDVKKPSKKTLKDVLDKFSSDDDVIAIGDVFFADVEQEWVMQPGGPLAHSCKTLIEPSRLILLTAQRFIQTFLGRDFVALHFRRHGFLKFCNAKQPSCFYPIPQAADCIGRMVERAQVPVVYLSTDAAESETGLLQSLILVNGKVMPLVKRPAPNSAEKWDALLYRNNIENDSQVEAMLDKTICAMSSVFIGTSGSTFTEDILRLRKDWGTASLCDEYLCQGEEPNFIADNE